METLKAGDWKTLPDLGEPIAEIEMTSTDDNDPEDLPWIDLAVFRDTPDRTIAPDAVVLEAPVFTLLLDYPMDVPALRDVHATNGQSFTRAEIMSAILSTYEAVYDSERLTQSVPTPPVEERVAILNRPASDGVFGVSNHDLDDLGVGTVTVYRVGETLWLNPVMES